MGIKSKALTLNEEQHIICKADANELLTCAVMAKRLVLEPSSL
jgi:hypothetical protein